MKRFLIIGILVTALCLLVTLAQAGIRVERKSGDLSNGLVGHWTFDGADISGNTAYDLSGQGNHGTINGPVKAKGKIGQGLNFSQNTHRVTMSGPDLGNTYTLSAWFNIRSFPSNWSSLISQDNYNAFCLSNTNKVSFFYSSTNHLNNTAINFNQWHHAAVVTNSGNVTFYLDGTADGTATGAPALDLRYIGTDASQDTLDGNIDDVRVYNRALGADEVKRLYNIGKGVSTAASQQNKQTSGLVGYWTFDGPDISGTTAYDRSGQGNNGTISGAIKKAGKLGQGLSFDGVNDNVNITDSDILSFGNGTTDTPFSIGAWVYMRSTADFPIFKKGASGGGGLEYFFRVGAGFTSGHLVMRLYDASLAAYIGREYTTNMSSYQNQWVYLATTYDASKANSGIKIYLNGSRVDNADAGSGSYVAMENLAAGAEIGIYAGSSPANGFIDDVRVYNRCLAADEVKALYNQAASKFHASQENQLTTGLVGYWPFNGPDVIGSVAYDRSGQGKNGTMVNSPLKIIGKVGQGIKFNGTNKYVDIPPPGYNFSNGYTVNLWIKTDNINGAPISAFSDGIYGIEYYGWGGDLSEWWGWTSGDWAWVDAGMLSDNQWHMYACTWDLNYMTSYRDDVQVQQKFYQNLSIGNSQIQIGKDTRGGAYFSGSIDEVRIYNRALSADEVKRLYNMGR